MTSGFAKPITIKEAIDNIDNNSYLLPAIQRKFVWEAYQIEILFDSIMRGYPINSFMFWEVKDCDIKNEFRFYNFLNEYREFFKDENEIVTTNSSFKDFTAVIDGQQRLTALYLGLKGSYAYKLPRKWWYDNQDNIPTRHLYLNLSKPLQKDNEKQAFYDFRFLTDREYADKTASVNEIWLPVRDMMRLYNSDKNVDDCIDNKGWLNKEFTKDTFRKLYRAIFKEPVINYYLETKQEIDTVLDIFIRTNSGGEPLSFSDLLMAITTAEWKTLDARKEIPEVIKKVQGIGSPGFMIDKNYILKTCLVLFVDNIKFRVKNFDRTNVDMFENNWARVKKSILECFKLLEASGFNNQNLRSKNATIPIVYYIYHRGIENSINDPLQHVDDKKLIKKWLCMALLKGVFSGHSDSVLTAMRKVIKTKIEQSQNPAFPLPEIKNEFKPDPAKNLTFDKDTIDKMLTADMDSPESYLILALLYAHLNFGQDYHKDHLHPASYFLGISVGSFNTADEYAFYSDPKNWNSVLNLQLLNSKLNQSKHDTPLQDWVNSNNIDLSNQLIPDNTSLDISNFAVFVEERKKLLEKQLINMIA